MNITTTQNTMGRVIVRNQVICAWCDAVIGKSYSDNGDASHGICPDCYKIQSSIIKKAKGESK